MRRGLDASEQARRSEFDRFSQLLAAAVVAARQLPEQTTASATCIIAETTVVDPSGPGGSAVAQRGAGCALSCLVALGRMAMTGKAALGLSITLLFAGLVAADVFGHHAYDPWLPLARGIIFIGWLIGFQRGAFGTQQLHGWPRIAFIVIAAGMVAVLAVQFIPR